MLNSLLVRINNYFRRKFLKRRPPGEIMLIFPHCLQNSECNNKIVNDLAHCKRCGKCRVKDLLELSERYQIKITVASGGQMALERIKSSGAKALIAVACEKELQAGIKGTFPMPVIAIPNERPKGPCKDCQVDPALVEATIRDTIL
jgi:hypothetical protein